MDLESIINSKVASLGKEAKIHEKCHIKFSKFKAPTDFC